MITCVPGVTRQDFSGQRLWRKAGSTNILVQAHIGPCHHYHSRQLHAHYISGANMQQQLPTPTRRGRSPAQNHPRAGRAGFQRTAPTHDISPNQLGTQGLVRDKQYESVFTLSSPSLISAWAPPGLASLSGSSWAFCLGVLSQKEMHSQLREPISLSRSPSEGLHGSLPQVRAWMIFLIWRVSFHRKKPKRHLVLQNLQSQKCHQHFMCCWDMPQFKNKRQLPWSLITWREPCRCWTLVQDC